MTSLPNWDDDWDEQVNNPSSSNQLYLNTTQRQFFENIIDPYPYSNDSKYYVTQNDSNYYINQGFVDEKLLLASVSASGDEEDGRPYLRSSGLRPVASSWTSRRAPDDATMAATNNMDAMKRVNFKSFPAAPPQATVASKMGISNKHSQIKYDSQPISGNAKGNYHAESMMFHEPLNYSSLQQGSNEFIDSSSSSSSSSSTNDRQQQQRERRRHHYTAHTGNSSSSSYSQSRVDLPTTTFDEFRCREVCLTASNKIKVVHDYLRIVKQHILQERTFTAENVKLLSSPFANDIQQCSSRATSSSSSSSSHDDSSLHGSSSSSSIGIPKEVLSLKHYSMDVQREVFECMKAVAECFDHRTTIYLGQLKKVRDLSNSATRNAIQYERADACLSLQKMKSSYDQQLEAELRRYKESNEKLQAEAVVLGGRMEAMVDEMKQLRELDRDRVEQQSNAVSAMRTRCGEEQKAHFEQLQSTSMVERDQLRQDAQRVLAEVKQQHEMNLRMEKEHSDKLQELLRRDKEALEVECERLRKELLSVNAMLTGEKEVFASRLREEKYNADKEQHRTLSEALKTQAQLKNEMMAMVARLQSDDHRKNTELEVKMNKFRESLLVTHTLEIDKMNDRHRAEMQKFVADGQIKMHDNVLKLKHIHEQELNRLLRDNDRLQRIIIRHGGAEHFRTMHAIDTNSSSSISTAVDHSHTQSLSHSYPATHQRQQQQHQPPPPPAPHRHHQGSSSSAVPAVVFRAASPPPVPRISIDDDDDKEEEKKVEGKDSPVMMTRSHHSNLASKLPIYSSRIKDSLTTPTPQSGRRSNSPTSSSSRGSEDAMRAAVKEGSSKSVSFQLDADHHPPPPPPPIPPSMNAIATVATATTTTADSNNNNNNRTITSRGSNNVVRNAHQESRATKSGTSGLNWGALEQSLNLQEQQEQSSSLHTDTAAASSFTAPPPDQFELNEALAVSMMAQKRKTSSNGVGLSSIESNVDRVNTYMNKLEAYLKGSKALLNVHNDDAAATGEALSDDHHPSILDTTTSSSSSSNSSGSNMSFNSQVAYKYLQAKEMLGIMASSSSSTAAAVDGSDYISDDSDSSDSLDRHLIQT